MSIPLPELTEHDIRNICDHAKNTFKQTDFICSTTSLADHHQQMSELEIATNGLEQIENVLEREVSRLKNSLDAIDSMKKDAARHHKRLTRSYWEIKKSPSQPHQ